MLLDATADGLTAEHAAERLTPPVPNTIEAPTKTLARRIADAFIDPFAGILAALSHWSRSTSTCSPCPSRSATPPRSSSSASCYWYRAA